MRMFASRTTKKIAASVGVFACAIRYRLHAIAGECHGIARRLRGFPLATAGIAAVEFAMILPVMLLLFLGMSEVTQGVNINRKVTILSRTIADITSRSSDGIDNAAMAGIFDAALSVMAPYDISRVTMRVSSVVVRDDDGSPVGRVCWSDGRGMGARARNSTVEVPAGFAIPGTSFILAEVGNVYTPMIGYAISGDIQLGETTPWPVRNVDEIERFGVDRCLT
jgi:Flp pilus assembly protein TadG